MEKYNPYENVENSIEGYKYVLELSISIDDPLDCSNGDRLCICDTRDECVEEIKKRIASYETLNKRVGCNITAEPYTITRLDCYIHWHDNDKGTSWWWSYGIYPVKYISKNNFDYDCK